MNISLLTVFGQIYESFLKTSLIARAQQKGLISFDIQEFFSFCKPPERIDTTTYGPGAGMVIKPNVVEQAIESQEKKYGKAFRIFLSPQGKKLDQFLAKEIAEIFLQQKHLMLVSSRYEGMDSRVEEVYADLMVSVGDVVLMGGDIPAMMLLETILRYVPGVVGKEESVACESFVGPFLDYPHYAPPVCWKGLHVPDIIRSGDHAKIDQWRTEKAAEKTVFTHFDWLSSYPLTTKQKMISYPFIPSHYAVLMHDEVVVDEDGRVGSTSITTLDIHDIARSANTYGIKHFFIVTTLDDQKKIAEKLLSFWHSEEGKKYNPNRAQAISHVSVVSSLSEVVLTIENMEKREPLVITTSAQIHQDIKQITYHDQSLVWALKKPILFVFGTGRGLSDQLLKKSDFVLVPIEGFSSFNHLSVRSAAAILFDRWLGINPKRIHDRTLAD